MQLVEELGTAGKNNVRVSARTSGVGEEGAVGIVRAGHETHARNKRGVPLENSDTYSMTEPGVCITGGVYERYGRGVSSAGERAPSAGL